MSTRILKSGHMEGNPSTGVRLIAEVARGHRDVFTVQLQFRGDPKWYNNSPTPTTNGELAKEVYNRIVNGD